MGSQYLVSLGRGGSHEIDLFLWLLVIGSDSFDSVNPECDTEANLKASVLANLGLDLRLVLHRN